MSQFDIEAIKNNINCRDIARNLLGKPEKTTRSYDKYFSPFRDDGNKPSFTVYANGVKDYGADGYTADTIGFVQEYLGIEFIEALEYLSGQNRFEPTPKPIERTERIDAPPSEQWQLAMRNFISQAHERLMQSPKIIEYLQQDRGLDIVTIQRYKLGYNPDWMPTGYRDDQGMVKAAPGIVIPWEYDKNLWAVRIRVPIGSLADYITKNFDYLDDKYLSIRGSKQSLGMFGDTIQSGDNVLLVEGEFDCMLAGQHFDDWKVLTRGSAGDHARIAPQWRKLLETTQNIYSLLDNDNAGQLATIALDSHFNNHHPLCLPIGNDFTDYVTKHNGDISTLKNQAKLWWSHSMPNAWRSAINNYMPPTAGPLIEAIHESARRGYIDPSCFTMADVLQGMTWLDISLSESTVKRVFKQVSEVFISFLVPIKDNNKKGTQNEINSNLGRKSTCYQLKPLQEIKTTMLKWARPRIVEKQLPAIETLGQSALMTTYEAAMLEAIGYQHTEAKITAEALNEVLKDARAKERRAYTRAMNKAKYIYENLKLSLSERDSIVLPEATITSAKDYRALLLRAVVEENPSERRSNREQGAIIGVDPQNVHRYRQHAGIENIPQFDTYPIEKPQEVKTQGYDVMGFPRQIIIDGKETGYRQDTAETIVNAAIERGQSVSIRYQMSSVQRIVRDSVLPVPPVEDEPIKDKQLALEDAIEPEVQPEIIEESEPAGPAEDTTETPKKSKVITMKPGNYYGEGYDPNWTRAQLRLALSRSQDRYILRDIQLIDTLTGEIIRQNADARDMIAVILGDTLEAEIVEVPSDYLENIAT